jgi:hypothetical protein
MEREEKVVLKQRERDDRTKVRRCRLKPVLASTE